MNSRLCCKCFYFAEESDAQHVSGHRGRPSPVSHLAASHAPPGQCGAWYRHTNRTCRFFISRVRPKQDTTYSAQRDIKGFLNVFLFWEMWSLFNGYKSSFLHQQHPSLENSLPLLEKHVCFDSFRVNLTLVLILAVLQFALEILISYIYVTSVWHNKGEWTNSVSWWRGKQPTKKILLCLKCPCFPLSFPPNVSTNWNYVFLSVANWKQFCEKM